MKRVCKNCERYPCIKNSAMQPEDKCTYLEDFIPRKNMIKKDIDLLVEELTNKYIFKTTMEDETIYFYNDGIYHDWGEILINKFLEEKKSETISSHEANEIVFHIKNNTYVSRKYFNTNKNFIHLQNGIFNLQDMKFEGFNPDIISTNKIPVFYDEKMDCPMIKKFLSEILKPKDIDVIQELFGYLLLKDYNIQKAFMFIGDGANGKCQIKGNRVLMSDGSWKNIEEIKIGDEVVSPQEDGKYMYSKVINLHNRFEKDIYEVRERNRKKRLLYTCAGNHDIPIIRNYSKRTSKDDNTPRIKKRILDHYEAIRLSKHSNNNSEFCSFTTTPIEYKQPNSSIDPYCLGAWLGDGHFSKQRIKNKNYKGGKTPSDHNPKHVGTNLRRRLGFTTQDEEIINKIKEEYPNEIIYKDKKPNNKSTTYCFTLKGKFVEELERLGLGGKGSGTKFIPKECLLSNIEYRKELLSGLIDTDGFVDKVGAIWITTKSKNLAEDIQYVVFSLGGFASIRRIEKSIKSINFKGKYYEVSIQFKNSAKTLSLRTKKKNRLKIKLREPRNIAIECVKTNSQMVYGIETDSPSKWYITDNWMITHNTTLLNLFKVFIGEDNISAVSLEKLLRNDFALAELYGKMANIHDDISDKALSYTGGFKMLTGGGTITAEKKYKKPFTFINYAKLIFTTNKLPESHDKTSAFFRRWIPINFPNIFEGNKKDTKILDKITTQNELSGLFNLAVVGLKNLMKNECFSNDISTDEMCVLYEKMSNSLFAFVQDRIVVDVNGFVSKEEFYNNFCEYCKENGLPIKAKAVVTQEIPQCVPSIRGEQKRIGKDRVRGWRGVRILKEEEKNNENDDVEQVEQPEIENFLENKENGVSQLEQPKSENFLENKKEVSQMAQPNKKNFSENKDNSKGSTLINKDVEHMEQPFLYCSLENKKKDIKVFDNTLCQPFQKNMEQVEQPKTENFIKNNIKDNKIGKWMISWFQTHKNIPYHFFEQDCLKIFPNINPEEIKQAYNILNQQEKEEKEEEK